MIHRLVTGKEFNQDINGHQFVKLTNSSEIHHSYQFQTGLNIDSIPFDPRGECRPGGIYFCSLDQLSLWLDYAPDPMFYVRFVTLPNDAQVWIEKDKFKADRLILSDRVKIADLDIWADETYCLRAVQQNGRALQYVKNQTDAINLEAVKQCPYALEYVNNQTNDICLEAVRRNGWALQYVNEQTEEICLIAVRQHGHALAYVKKQTPEICRVALQSDCYASKYVKDISSVYL
jgi:hypothetical protein